MDRVPIIRESKGKQASHGVSMRIRKYFVYGAGVLVTIVAVWLAATDGQAAGALGYPVVETWDNDTHFLPSQPPVLRTSLLVKESIR